MTVLTLAERNSVHAALDALQRILDCYDALPAAARDVPQRWRDEIERVLRSLRDMNRRGLIDFKPQSNIGIVAETDRNGIHLNPDFGENYRNDYQLYEDYLLEDCREGYFYSLWRLLEILIHEHFHWENHSGRWALTALFVDLAYGTVGNVIEGLAGLLARAQGRRRLVRKYSGREHQAYSYAHHMLFWIDSLLFDICFHTDPDCIPCCEEHQQRIRAARERQNPYEWR